MTKRIGAIIGRPGAGKSSLVRRFMEATAKDWRQHAPASLLKCHRSDALGLDVIGDYSDPDETFPGTDRLSMGVAPSALDWMRSFSDDVLFEGDRLGNASTLRLLSLTPGIELSIWHVYAPDHELMRRYMLRGSAQSATVLQARATKVANICANPNFRILTRRNASIAQREGIVEELTGFFMRETWQ